VERTLAGTVLEELQLVGRAHTGDNHKGLSSVVMTPCWNRGKV